jgi:hypothetical protein
MEIHLICYYIGILIVFGSNAYVIFNNKDKDMINHSYLNIFAALLIAYYFMDKEKIWDYLKEEKVKVKKIIEKEEEDYNC